MSTVDKLTGEPALLDAGRDVVIETLGLVDGSDLADASSGLFGSLPEPDSLAVVELILALEERFGIDIDGDDVTLEVFDTLGSLSGFVHRKSGGS